MKTFIKILLGLLVIMFFNLKSYSNIVDSVTTVQYIEQCWGTKYILVLDEDRTGEILVFDCKNNLLGSMEYKNGLKHGKTIMYKNNKLYGEAKYKYGVRVKTKYFN
jgi:antitoxin component YwqK of YwqJK toxin-antitoxin module